MYTIYHIEGVKIGCSNNPNHRVKEQGYSVFQVLEVHEDIEVASNREIELQIEYGYGRDTRLSYSQIVNRPTREGCIKGGKIVGKKNKENGHLSRIGKIGGKIAGKKSIETGHMKKMFDITHINKTCPYCFKTILGRIYYRWHGDRCKLAPLTKDI